MVRAALPDLDALDIEALKALVVAQHEERQRHLEALAQQREEHQAERLSHTQQIERLKLVVEKLRRMLFGRKSEKLSLQLDQLELQLEEMEAIHAGLASATTRDTEPDGTGAAKPARKPLPDHLVRETVTHKSEQSCCPECGGGLRHFGEDVSEQLEYVPDRTTRLTSFDPPQPDRLTEAKGSISSSVAVLGSPPSDEDAGDHCREGERRAHDG